VVLTNAIYFKGKWKSAFPEAATRNDTFTLSTGKTIGDVPLMSQQGAFRYLDGGSFQALELPYDANQQSMIVFLPKRADGLAELEKTLTATRVADWLAQLTVRDVKVTLPRFKVTAEFQLKAALTDLGMPLAFSPGKADFSAIATGQPLALSAVIHKAYVDVNEKGTEAAAATGAIVTPRLPAHPIRRRCSAPTIRSSSSSVTTGPAASSSPGAWSIHRRSDESARHAFLLECPRRRHGGQVTSC
jgi:serpin B